MTDAPFKSAWRDHAPGWPGRMRATVALLAVGYVALRTWRWGVREARGRNPDAASRADEQAGGQLGANDEPPVGGSILE